MLLLNWKKCSSFLDIEKPVARLEKHEFNSATEAFPSDNDKFGEGAWEF
jgi:hypothetical protein